MPDPTHTTALYGDAIENFLFGGNSRLYTLPMSRHYSKVLLNVMSLVIVWGAAQATSCALSGACKEVTFGATINGGQEFTYRIGSNLEVYLAPSLIGGWTISVRPRGSDDDWTSPLNLPISGEAQNLGTGWAMSAVDSLSEPRSLRFALTQAEFDHYRQLAFGPHSPNPNQATNFIEAITKAVTGKIVFKALDFQDGGSPETIKWLRFSITVTVPQYFRTVGLNWRRVPCASHLQVRD